MSNISVKVDTGQFLDLTRRCGLVPDGDYRHAVASLKDALTGKVPDDPTKVADAFVQDGLLTRWQADNLLRGKHKGFSLGSYRLLGLLGTGGMSSVYLAEHTLMRRRVAIKVLPHSKVADSSYLARFRREAEAVAQLNHTNIVRAYDISKEGRTHYFVMEYVDGKDLLEMVQDDGPMEYRRAADYIAQAAEGLQHAHDAGLIHRDMKPANCLVEKEDNTLKVLDMGLALFSEDDRPSLTLAHDENVLGTADYLAPEQAINSHNVDSRADVYALGCTFYFLLTGHPPFPTGTMSERLIKHQREKPSPIRSERKEAPADLVAICDAMMAKSRRKRIQTCGEVAERLRAWLAGRPSGGKMAKPARKPPSKPTPSGTPAAPSSRGALPDRGIGSERQPATRPAAARGTAKPRAKPSSDLSRHTPGKKRPAAERPVAQCPTSQHAAGQRGDKPRVRVEDNSKQSRLLDDDWDKLLGIEQPADTQTLLSESSRRSSTQMPVWIWGIVALGAIIVGILVFLLARR